MNRTLGKALAGAAGGLVGGVVVSAIVQAGVSLGIDPASDMVQMQRRGLAKARRPARAPQAPTTLPEEALGHGWHLGLSAALGAIYGACRPRLERRPAASGALWGLLFYPLAFWLLGPLTGLTERPWREGWAPLFRRPLVHLAFGATTGVAAAAVHRLLAPEEAQAEGAAPAPSSAALLQPGWLESQRSVNGISLHVVEAGRPGDPLLILLHGFPEFWWAWRHQITPLAEAGYHVVAPDMRGYNTSDAPASISDYRLDTLAADVVALADAYGADRFRLVGHDWGAVVGWQVAARYPERLGCVVLMDGPHPDVWARQARTHPTQALRSTYAAFFQLPGLPEAVLGGFGFAGLRAMLEASARPHAFEPGALRRYAEAWGRPGSLTAMLNYYRAMRRRSAGRSPARIRPRTLILWGSGDLFLERHVAEAGLALCDDGRLEVVEGASHWLHLEQPWRITRRIIDFLA